MLVLTALLCFPTCATCPLPTPQVVTADREDEARRLLCLADGRVLRGPARRVADTWQVRRAGAWVDVPGQVVRARMEREVLDEARGLRESAGSEPGRAAELVRWMGEQGLYEEGLAELGALLRAAPDDPAALRAAATLRLDPDEGGAPEVLAGVEIASRLQRLLLTGAQGNDARREVALGELARWGRLGVDLRSLLAAEIAHPQNRHREFGARAARRLLPGELREELATRSILEGWGEVRREAALGLRDARDVAVIGPALRALGSAHATVRGQAAESLGVMGYRAAVEPLVNHLAASVAPAAGSGAPAGTRANLFAGLETAYVMDFDVEIAQGASIADPQVGVQASGVVFDVRTTVEMSKVLELRAVMGSLRALTGEKLPDDPGRWLEWWKANGERWRALDHAEREHRVSARGSGASR